MPLPAWPIAVPSGARDGWQMSAMFAQAIATEMDGGNQRRRARPGDNVATVQYPLQPLSISGGAWAAFDTFMRTTLNNGSSRWTMSVTIAGALVSKTVQLDGNKSPTSSQQGDYMHVILPLRIYGM